ncbi:MAG: phenylalanine--tRNA ligase subunit beta [Clostridiales bacterium]|nr:phenylalanine--tRNA ligase subunit beta [Clostridiales bacterium]
MLIPVSWLREYVDIDISIEELCDRMIMTGSNVEGIEIKGDKIEGVVVGKILTIKPHEDADRLLVCKVDIGGRIIQVVTGASNISEGDLVPVAVDDARLPGGIKIRRGKLRGELSEGMLCSGEELELTDEDYEGADIDGILILTEDYELGMDIKKALLLGDEVIEFEITPNRSDCLSVIGIAREVATTIGTTLKLPNIEVKPTGGDVCEKVEVVVEDTDLCPRYCARVVEDVVIEKSPMWMRRRLADAGIRPINNIVDITNYVMLEMGQPMHAFDLDKVEDRTIIVDRAIDGEMLTTLDDVDRILTPDMLTIRDTKRAIALAGVMGGLNTEIDDKTSTIVLESAKFDGASVRSTSRKLGLRSEASSRFEKGLDINLPVLAIDRAVQLIQDLGAGRAICGVLDVLNADTTRRHIEVNWKDINRLLGVEIAPEKMIDILISLDFEADRDKDKLNIVIPTYRQDIEGMEDIAEEVARIYGYDRIPKTLTSGSGTRGKKSPRQKLFDLGKETLVGMGLYEIVTYSFISPKDYNKIDKDMPKVVTISNPLGEDQSIMRTTLIPSMLDVLSRNSRRRVELCKLFEIGKIFLPKSLPLEELPIENHMLSMGLYGDGMDFFYLKGIIETLFHEFGIKDGLEFVPMSEDSTFHPGRTANLKVKGISLGIMGEIHPKIAGGYGIDMPVILAELSYDKLLDLADVKKSYMHLPRYPAVDRDLSIVVKEDVLAGHVEAVIKAYGKELLESIELFDVYSGGQIPTGYKSMAYSLSYRASDRTLKDEDVGKIHDKVIKGLEKDIDARLR